MRKWLICLMLAFSCGLTLLLGSTLADGTHGSLIAVGMGAYELLPRKKKPAGRRFAQLLVGIYMLGFLGLIEFENMQLGG
jgi:hypothetical protein